MQKFVTDDNNDLLFYSTYARVLISTWQSLLALIQEYAKSSKTGIPTNEQIKATLEHALNLLKENFKAIATYQKTIITLNKKRALINEQLNLIGEAMQAVIKNPNQPPEIEMPELEKQSKEVSAKLTNIKNLLAQTVSLGAGLNELMKQYGAEWENLQKQNAEKALASFEKNLAITFGEEKNELLSPTKSKNELIADLGKFNLLASIKDPQKTDVFTLRLYWLLGAAKARSFSEIDFGSATKIIKNLQKEKIETETSAMAKWQETYQKQNGELQKFEQEARDLLGLPLDNENKLRAMLLAFVEKPGTKILPLKQASLSDLITGKIVPE
jgi:hypothetical protein